VENKWACLAELLKTSGVDLAETAYMGDDVNDFECLCIAGFSACPADAVERVKSTVHHVSEYLGGMGAVREVCEMIRVSKLARKRAS
jgi:3-deoxy-D-manno-octulosonate 8-phosphate phosphatase (KDO 8-P phosphatase)